MHLCLYLNSGASELRLSKSGQGAKRPGAVATEQKVGPDPTLTSSARPDTIRGRRQSTPGAKSGRTPSGGAWAVTNPPCQNFETSKPPKNLLATPRVVGS